MQLATSTMSFSVILFVGIATAYADETRLGAAPSADDVLHPDAEPILLDYDDTMANEDPQHAAGLRPLHHSSAMLDPNFFEHRYQHHDPTTDRLVYYQYRARRHKQVVMLDELGVQSCVASPSESHTNLTVVTLTMHPTSNIEANITNGAPDSPASSRVPYVVCTCTLRPHAQSLTLSLGYTLDVCGLTRAAAHPAARNAQVRSS